MLDLLLIFTDSVCVILPDIWQFKAWNRFLAVSLDLYSFYHFFYQKPWSPPPQKRDRGEMKSCDWLAGVVCVFPVAYVSFFRVSAERRPWKKSNPFYRNAAWFILLQSSFQTNLPVRWNIKAPFEVKTKGGFLYFLGRSSFPVGQFFPDLLGFKNKELLSNRHNQHDVLSVVLL